MPEHPVYWTWQGSVLTWRTGDTTHVVWALSPTEPAPVAPKPKAKRSK